MAEAKAFRRGADTELAGNVVQVDFQITRHEMDAFRDLCGDMNPIHLDPAYAMQRGFTGAVVYGGLLIAQISRLLGTRLPGPGCVWRSLSIRFRTPLYVDEHASIMATVRHVNSELGLYELALRVRAGSRLVADGEASAILAQERFHA